MNEVKPLESLIGVFIPGVAKTDPLEQSQETLRIAQEVCAELAGLTKRCKQIQEIDGKPASIVGLRLTGMSSIENVEITYIQDDKRLTREYPIDDFYK